MVNKHYTEIRNTWQQWDGAPFLSNLAAGLLTSCEVKRSMALRCLCYQAPPPGAILESQYCEQSTAGMDRHVFHHCVPFRMTIIRGLMEPTSRTMPAGKVIMMAGGEQLMGNRGEIVQYVPDGLTGPSGGVDRPTVLIRHTGLMVDRQPHYRPATKEQLAGVVRPLGLPAQTWISILQRIEVWQHIIDAQQVTVNRPDVTYWRDTWVLPLVLQVILVVVTTALPVWRVQAFGQLALHLPQRSQSWSRPPTHVYVGQRAQAEEILALAEHRHRSEGVVIIMDNLGPSQPQPWMKGLNKFNITGQSMLVTRHLMAWLDPDGLRPMKEGW